MLGCGLPGGEQGYNMGRIVAVQLGYDFLPGTTITRYCSSSLQTTRMAAHAIRAGEGDAYISAGVETVSRFVKGNSDSYEDTKNPLFADAEARTAETAQTEGADWHDPREDGVLPDAYIAMGETAENLARLKGISRLETGRVRGLLAEPCREGHRERLLRAGDHAGHHPGRHGGLHRRRPARRHHAGGHRRAQAGLSPGRHRHRRQRLPAERRRLGRAGDERHQGRRAGAHPAGPDRLPPPSPACRRRSWASGRTRR